MEALKNYLVKNFEQVFVLLILVSVASINYLIPYKLAFLNFYFIPILLGAYYLGVHRALLGGVLCTLVVTLYAYLFPASFMPAFSQLDLWMNILTWSSFLILTGAAVGKLADRLKREIKELKGRKRDLETQIDHMEEQLATRVS